MQGAAQLFSARTAVRHEMDLPLASERAAYFGPVLAPLALPPAPPERPAQKARPPQVGYIITLHYFLSRHLTLQSHFLFGA